jgi:CubicO group peptidase (beta-lactamase class C family)
MPTRGLTALALLTFAAPALGQTDAATHAAARMQAFPAPRAVTAVDAYQPAEIVRGSGRPLALGTDRGGISADAMAKAQDYVDAQKSFAFVVLRDGRVVHEHYAPGFDAASRFSPASMHKTVMALAMGAARLPLDAPIARWLPEWKDDARGAITLHQLLSMASGLETPPFSPNPAGPAMQLMFGPDIAATALAHRQTGTPGTFAYGNANSQIAGLILERATKRRYADHLSRSIWRPIGASDATVWLDRPGGNAHSFCCLQASARDYARIGQLILDKGRVRGRQVVPAGWITQMAAPSAGNANYGLQLWRGAPYVAERRYNAVTPLVARASAPYARDDVLFLDGAVGQRVYIVPSERLVIVRIGESAMGWDDSMLPNLILAGLPTPDR